jgi:hypothetical protein
MEELTDLPTEKQFSERKTHINITENFQFMYQAETSTIFTSLKLHHSLALLIHSQKNSEQKNSFHVS